MHKYALTILMVVFMIFLLLPASAFAAEEQGDLQVVTDSTEDSSIEETTVDRPTVEASKDSLPSTETEGEVLEETVPVVDQEKSGLTTEALNTENLLEMMSSTTSFIPRLSAPSTNSAYYYSDDNPFYKYGYGMPNCTCYAWGRAYEILGSKPNLSIYNANTFWTINIERGAYDYGSTPKLGAIACWANGDGHVAVVEKIEGNQVTVSESSWSGFLFRTDTYTIGCEGSKYPYGFQGYIYLGNFSTTQDTQDTTAPTISNVQITDEDALGFTVKATVSDNQGVTKVQYPTWTDANSQDDIKWNAGSLDGNSTSYRVLYSDHNNEKGKYIVHIYAYDAVGNSGFNSINFETETTAAISYVGNIELSKAPADAYGNVDGENGINSVDALETLKYAVGFTDFSQYTSPSFTKIKANVSGDFDTNNQPKITSVDALEILQRSVDIMDAFPVEK